MTAMPGPVLTASSYFGLISALVPLAQPDNRFVVSHARGAIRLHLLRVVLILPVLVLPVTDHSPSIWIVAVVVLTWAAQLAGAAVALTGGRRAGRSPIPGTTWTRPRRQLPTIGGSSPSVGNQ